MQISKLVTVAGLPFLWVPMQISKLVTIARTPFSWVPMQISKLVTVARPLSLGTYANCKVGHRSPTPFSGYLCKFQSWSPWPDLLSLGTYANFVKLVTVAGPPSLGTYANFKVGHRSRTPFSGYLSKFQSWSPWPNPFSGYLCKFQSWSP